MEQSETDLPQADHIRINDIGPVMRASGNGIELAPMRFGFPPPKPRGAPVFNFRSEGRHFAKSKRCLIPASALFEFTGKKYPKAMHRFTLCDAPFMAIAGIWPGGQGDQPAFTMLTTPPGPDVSPYHNRQVVVLRPEDWGSLDISDAPGGGVAAAAAAGFSEGGNCAPGQRLSLVDRCRMLATHLQLMAGDRRQHPRLLPRSCCRDRAAYFRLRLIVDFSMESPPTGSSQGSGYNVSANFCPCRAD